jgi:hypothetical protein
MTICALLLRQKFYDLRPSSPLRYATLALLFVPGFSDSLKFAVVAGAVAGGGLTVIANAPNPAGQSILASRFGDEGISALKLLLWAILPTAIMGAAFMLLR